MASLKPHPRNYRTHPPDQLEHIKRSITEHGVYRNIVVARDSTILAGHGVAKACGEMGIEEVSVMRLPIDPGSPAALKLLAGDNEIGHLAEVDDLAFTAILKEVQEIDSLLGTGYDDAMLANLLFITQGVGADHDAAADWADAGMPEYANGFIPHKLIISFRSAEDREQFVQENGIGVSKKESKWWSAWWPPRAPEDISSLRFEKAGQ